MAVKKTNTKTNLRSLEAKGFYSDVEKDGCLYAALVRSPAPAGKIKSITAPDLPEGYFLYTSRDIPGTKTITANKTVTKIFGYGNVSYSGEPVGILFGPDEETVYKLLDTVNINFDVENLESALHNVINNQTDEASNFKEFVDQINEMPSLDTVIDKSHVEENPNVIVATREIKYGLYESLTLAQADAKLFENADYTSTDTWKEKLLTPKWQETEGAFAYTEGERIHVFAPSRWASFTQKSVAAALDIDEASVFIHKTKSAGIYPSGLARTTQLAVQIAAAAWLSKKPVKLILSQTEQESFMVPGVVTEITYRSALNKDGRLKALKISIDIDIGCSNPFAQEITDRIAIAAASYYKPENLYINAKAHTSKNPPTSISMQIIESQAFFAIENEIQKISNLSMIFPDELRLLNAEPPVPAPEEKTKKTKKTTDKKTKAAPVSTEFPFDIPTGDVRSVIQTALSESDFNRKYASFHMDAIDRAEKDSKPFFALPLRGIGVATAYIPSGYSGQTSFSNDAKIEVTLSADEKLVIHTIKPSDVIQDIWKNSAAEILQIPKQNIQINSEFPYNELPEAPEDSYSSISIVNELVKKCCNDIQKKRFHQPLPITAKRGGTAATAKPKWNKEKFCGTPFYTTSFITTVVEVELDTYTYNEKIKGIWVTVDCGELFDEAAARRTIRLEIQQELTMLVKGKTVPCDAININFIQSNNRSGQVGGLIHNSLPAAFSSALSLALTTQLTEIPCTEDLLFQLIRDRTKEKTETRKSENQGASE
ncbi:CO or xanthine dehydrogenase, Mo-binding subunit [Treponema bryantii]|uniref:CO or xanthine dehydrogenase, Mo-binding subunit n=1 Tax=Treponema bryantii TaxID=163 RepID=A0A1H9A6V5_9SPIR|nr:xanthine dehydrogenase family protein [Treponema bryantii]SEP72420.1 CO or xanthine dehydrogenase, Mo-binding subunit [Treponema bryantii]